MEVARLLGRDDNGCLSEHEAQLLRILSPLLKLFASKQTMQVVSEGLECFGGQGYIEDTGLPAILRDSQVIFTFICLPQCAYVKLLQFCFR